MRKREEIFSHKSLKKWVVINLSNERDKERYDEEINFKRNQSIEEGGVRGIEIAVIF